MVLSYASSVCSSSDFQCFSKAGFSVQVNLDFFLAVQQTYAGYICPVFFTVYCVAVEEQGDPVSVELEKGTGGVGFTLEGGKGSIHGDKPLVVNRIFIGTLMM